MKLLPHARVKKKPKTLMGLSFALLLVIFKWHHGSEGVNSKTKWSQQILYIFRSTCIFCSVPFFLRATGKTVSVLFNHSGVWILFKNASSQPCFRFTEAWGVRAGTTSYGRTEHFHISTFMKYPVHINTETNTRHHMGILCMFSTVLKQTPDTIWASCECLTLYWNKHQTPYGHPVNV